MARHGGQGVKAGDRGGTLPRAGIPRDTPFARRTARRTSSVPPAGVTARARGTPGRPGLLAPRPPPQPPWFPRTIWPTREGWWFIGAILAIGLAAINTGNNLLYLIVAMLLSVMALSGALSEQTLRRLDLHREGPARLFAGSPAPFTLWVGNRKRRLPSYALHLSEDRPSGEPALRQFFLKLGPQEREAWRYTLTFPRRGRHRLPGLRLSTRFPFGLFAKTSRPLLSQPVLVFPALHPLAPDEIPAALDPGWRDRDRRGHGASLRNLRPYRPGDDPRLLHWKSSAKAGELMVKELEDEERPCLSLLLEDPAPGTPPDLIERNLSFAASLAALASRRGAELELVTAEGTTGLGQGPTHLDRLLERLALYEVPAAPRTVAPPDPARRSARIRLDGPRPPAAGRR
jgi:uncharacterized protein (DUF58 family)